MLLREQLLTEASQPEALISSTTDQVVAALDIGSNSFHMVIARRVGSDFQILERLKEQVRLASALDAKLMIDKSALKRSKSCLSRFVKHLKGIPAENIRAVATHTLRIARNSDWFLDQIKDSFPVPIRIIPGTEEARLIYQGVSHISDIRRQVLVIDIGGGSTEFIVGENFVSKRLQSSPIGCVNFTRQFFDKGQLSSAGFNAAVAAADKEIESFRQYFLDTGWELCLGSSGSIKTIAKILKAEGYHKRTITLEHLLNLRDRILEFKKLADIKIPGLPGDRVEILPAAVAILIAAFKGLQIDRMEFSRGALREGLLYDMID